MKAATIGLYLILVVEWLATRAATQIAAGVCAGTGAGLIATTGISGFAVGIGNSLGGFIVPALSNQPTNRTTSNGMTTSNDLSSLSGFTQFTVSWWLKTVHETLGIFMASHTFTLLYYPNHLLRK